MADKGGAFNKQGRNMERQQGKFNKQGTVQHGQEQTHDEPTVANDKEYGGTETGGHPRGRDYQDKKRRDGEPEL